MAKYSKFNIVYRLQRWMDSVAGQTFLHYAYNWGAAVVILGTLFKLTHFHGADIMLCLGMGTEVFVFFISAFDRPFDKTSDGFDLKTDHELEEEERIESEGGVVAGIGGGTVVIGGGAGTVTGDAPVVIGDGSPVVGGTHVIGGINGPMTPAPAVSQETAESMEEATSTYVERLNELNITLEKVAQLSKRLTTDSEEMENLNRTLTGIAKVYEMQLKSASLQIGTQDEINEKIRKMAEQMEQLNSIYARMIEAMTVNMPGAAKL